MTNTSAPLGELESKLVQPPSVEELVATILPEPRDQLQATRKFLIPLLGARIVAGILCAILAIATAASGLGRELDLVHVACQAPLVLLCAGQAFVLLGTGARDRFAAARERRYPAVDPAPGAPPR